MYVQDALTIHKKSFRENQTHICVDHGECARIHMESMNNLLRSEMIKQFIGVSKFFDVWIGFAMRFAASDGCFREKSPHDCLVAGSKSI